MTPVVLVSLDWRRPQDGLTGLGIASINTALQALERDFLLGTEVWSRGMISTNGSRHAADPP